ncbi:hypothetical protein C8R44DRAFT_752424 [Mycena epipterygia]|nr:hypothetical protein C8R44DRAFT_752424 [Mycena epipterygia]
MACAWHGMSRTEFPGSKVAVTINHGGKVDRNVPKVVRDKIDDSGTVVNPRTSQATSQATPSTPAPPNSNSAKGRKPFGQAIPTGVSPRSTSPRVTGFLSRLLLGEAGSGSGRGMRPAGHAGRYETNNAGLHHEYSRTPLNGASRIACGWRSGRGGKKTGGDEGAGAPLRRFARKSHGLLVIYQFTAVCKIDDSRRIWNDRINSDLSASAAHFSPKSKRIISVLGAFDAFFDALSNGTGLTV